MKAKVIKKKACTKYTNINIDYDKISMAIVKAQKLQEIEEEKLMDDKRKNWAKLMHQSETLNDNGLVGSVILSIKNTFCGLISLVFFNSKNAINDNITYNVLQLFCTAIFSVFSFALYLIWVILVAYPFIRFNDNTLQIDSFLPLLDTIICIAFSFFALLFASIFRIASHEIEHMKDKNNLIAILSGTTSFIAMIIAIIALLQGGDCNCMK